MNVTTDWIEITEAPETPGLYPGVTAEQYHRWPLASQTILKVMRDRSPAHAYEQMMNPTPPTPALRLGDATHVAVLQPDLFPARYVVAPDMDRRTKAGKAAWAEFEAENPLAEILKADEYQQCLRMRDAVWSNPTAKALLEGNAEISAVWNDPTTGIRCKGRFDDHSKAFGAIVDLKTTKDASRTAFTKAIYNFGYYIQAAMYLIGAKALDLDADLFAIIAVEKEPPYCVAVYQIEDEALKAGRDELKPLIERYAECQASGLWPGYDEEPVEISLPPWSWNLIDERVGISG